MNILNDDVINRLESEDTFVEYVAGTQDLASTRIGDQSWLKEDPVKAQINQFQDSWLKDQPKSSRRSSKQFVPPAKNLASNLRNLLLAKEDQVASTSASSVTPGTSCSNTPQTVQRQPKSNRRRSNLLDEGPSQAKKHFKSPITLSPRRRRSMALNTSPASGSSVRRKFNFSDEEGEVNVTARDLSSKVEDEVFFRTRKSADFSSDSAKELMRQLEEAKGKEKPGTSSLALEPQEADAAGKDEVPLNEILKDVVAFVEVRSKHENRSKCVQDQLRMLGAEVVDKLSKSTTHYIFKEGTLATYNKAKKMGIHIVSVTWIEACKKDKVKVSESLFPSVSKTKYDSPGLFPKLRKAKSMQPKSEEEMEKRMEANMNKWRKQRKKKQDLSKAAIAEEPEPPKIMYPVPLDYYNSPKVAKETPKAVNKDSLMNVIDELGKSGTPLTPLTPLKLNKSLDAGNVSDSSFLSSPCNSEDMNTPLARRLANKYFNTPASGAEKVILNI